MKERFTWKGAVFDLDGTLLDSMGVWRKIDRDFLAKRGMEVPMDYMKAISAMHFYQAAEYTIQRFGFTDTPEMLVEEWKDMAKEAYAHEVGLKPGVSEYLKALKACGVKIAAATSGEKSLFLPCLENNGILGDFDVLVTTAEAKRGKGFPDVYELAAEKSGLSNIECMVFEDILQGIRGAKMGHFAVTGILDEHSGFEWDEIRKEADRYAVDFTELLQEDFL